MLTMNEHSLLYVNFRFFSEMNHVSFLPKLTAGVDKLS